MPNSSSSTPTFNEIIIDTANSGDFDQFFAIYKEALPAGERKPRSVIEQLIDRPDYRILGLKDTHEVVAFAIVFSSVTREVGLLEYMATKITLRNAGLGARLFRMALASMHNRVMLVEVDSEREEAADRDVRIHRKNFYLRQGCIQIPGLDYVMPAVSDERPPIMDLLYHPGAHLSLRLSPALVETWLATIYAEVYDRNPHDPDILKMMMTLKC